MMRKIISLGLLLASCLQLNAFAGLISLDQQDITSDSDVFNNGLLVSANSFGASPVAGTINGVNFGTDQSGLSNFVNGGGDFANQFTPGSGLDLVLSNLVFTPNHSPGSLTLTGLDIGKTYRLQLLFSNVLNGTGHNMLVSLLGGNENIVAMGNRAINVYADFTADSSVVTTQFHNQGSYRTVFNGYALHELNAVPEPTTMALMGMGLGGLVFARRKRQSKKA